MPEWMHDRAEHLLAKNPSMSKSQAFAVATQQSHAQGKSPKGYGTKAGKREAKEKFDKPKKEYVVAANPGKLESPKMDKEKSSSPASDAYGGSQESDKVAAGFYAKMAEVEEWHDQVPGGNADGKKPEDFDQVQLAKGMMVEREHVGDDLDKAEEIASDHLIEFPDYYTELEKMETKLEKKAWTLLKRGPLSKEEKAGIGELSAQQVKLDRTSPDYGDRVGALEQEKIEITHPLDWKAMGIDLAAEKKASVMFSAFFDELNKIAAER